MPGEVLFLVQNCYMHSENIFYERDLVENSLVVWTISLFKVPCTSDPISVFVKCIFFLKHEIHGQ